MLKKFFERFFRKFLIGYNVWSIRREFRIDETPFNSAEYLTAVSELFDYVDIKDLEDSNLVDIELLLHGTVDDLILAIDVARDCLEHGSKIYSPLTGIPKPENAYSWLLTENEDKEIHYEVIRRKLKSLSNLIQDKKPGRSFERGVKPLCEDLDRILDILEKL